MDTSTEQKTTQGTYGPETPEATGRAQELFEKYRATIIPYRVTTEDSDRIIEVIKTAGDLRTLLMKEENTSDRYPLSQAGKKVLYKAYEEAGDTIKYIARDVLARIQENILHSDSDSDSIGNIRILGETLEEIFETAIKDHDIPYDEITEIDPLKSGLHIMWTPDSATKLNPAEIESLSKTIKIYNSSVTNKKAELTQTMTAQKNR